MVRIAKNRVSPRLCRKKRLSGFPKVAWAEPENRALARGFLQKWTGSVITAAGVVPGKRPVPAKPNEVASELFQDAQNFRPGDGHFVQFDSQAGLALGTSRSADNGRDASQIAHHGFSHFVVRPFAVLASWPRFCKARHAGSID